MAAEAVTFDGNDPSTISGFSVIGIYAHRQADRDMTVQPLARADRSSVSSAFYTSRKVHLLATLQAASKSAFQTQLRALEAMLQTREGLLVVPIGGVSTQFTATKDNILLNNDAGGFAELDIEFTCSDPMGYAVSSTTMYNIANFLVGNAYSFASTWSGNVPQQPVITITYVAAPGAGSASV